MNILIRSVPEDIDKRLTYLASCQGKSKQSFLLEQIRHIAIYPELSDLSDKYELLVRDISEIIKQNTSVLEKIYTEGKI